MHAKYKTKLENKIKDTFEFNLGSIEESLEKMAISFHKAEKGGDIVIPRMLIRMLKEKYNSDLSIDELCTIYTKKYFQN